MPSAENLILIAEDHPVNREVAILQLQQLGLAAHAVENGTAAIDAIQRVPYALVLMDCQMPELDGYEATRQIRRAEAQSGRHVPIIAMTAHAMQGDREACLSAGMDDYISKPVTMERLEAVVRHWMPKVKVQAQSPEPAVSTASQPDPSPANGASVDFKVIEDLRSMQGSDPTFLRQLVTTFFSQSGLLLENMRSAVSRSDAESLRQSAHKLKGGCGVLGVKNLANICYDAEMQARTGRLDGALEKVERAEAEYERVKAALESVAQGGLP
jgi:CheY-like chemotaxis protein/HPt (histidine-containing phosphotransfer) domain-containing protein